MKNDPKLIQAFLKEKQQQHLYRKAHVSQSPQQPHMKINGENILTFCSNDYLGLTNHPEIISAFKQAADKYGVGSGAAHLISGHSVEHQKLEEELAEFTGRDRALLFSTGYMANLGAVNALMERGDAIFADRLNHASLIDAGLLSNAKMKRYAHNDTHGLETLYSKDTSKNTMILTDGVFSMDGDIAPVKQLSKIAKQHNAWLMVDDAHGFGTLGKTGAGLLEQENLNQDDAPILMATLGKAIGTAGAFVAGSSELIEYLIQTARTYTFTTAMPPAIAAATRASLRVVRRDHERREILNLHIQQFKKGAAELGIKLMPSDTAIQPIMVRSTEQTVKISEHLHDSGILVTAIRPPTIPEGTARLRVTLSAEHTEADIVILLGALQSAFSLN